MCQTARVADARAPVNGLLHLRLHCPFRGPHAGLVLGWVFSGCRAPGRLNEAPNATPMKNVMLMCTHRCRRLMCA